MGTQGYRANYREAFECANDQLEAIYSEYHDLQHRKEQLDAALTALGPFLKSARISPREEINLPEPVRFEPFQEPEALPEPVMHSATFAEPAMSPAPTPETVVAPSYAPVSETNLDPIQARINRALGLAVA